MYSQLPMYQRQGKAAFKKDLANIKTLSYSMGEPHKRFETIHIAGTNGKGTTAHMIAAGLQAHGLRVGMYTSPHYIDFRERIKINGQFIPEAEVVAFVERYKELFEVVSPSFFEMTVAMAFYHFAQEEVDIAIIEVGLGGRLDSTNIITPELSIITNISLDHQHMLGDTLPLIAAEKAGIIKAGVPIIIGESQSEVAEIFSDKAEDKNTELTYADKKLRLSFDSNRLSAYFQRDHIFDIPMAYQPSDVQLRNMTTAIYALLALREKYSLEPETIAKGIANVSELTYYIGRYQELRRKPLILADSAHNIAGVTELLNYIHGINFDNLHIVIGMVSDKDVDSVLGLLPKTAKYYLVKADIPRGMPTDVLASHTRQIGISGQEYKSVKQGYTQAIAIAGDYDLVLVMGSIFVVAEVLATESHKED